MTDDVTSTASAPPARRPAAFFAAQVRFRRAAHKDADALEPMINEAYLRETWLLPAPRITLAQLKDVLADPEQHVTIAELDGALVGSIRLSRHDGELYFGLLAVAPACQGHGLASLLVGEAERQARETGDRVLRLDCAKELGLPSFYQSLGYEVESETPGSYYDDRQSGRRKGPFTLVILKKALS